MAAELPPGKSLKDILADFICYLFGSAKAFIQESEPMGKMLWGNFERNIDLILSHPRGWGDREQEFLRKSVVQASVFTEEDALSHIYFVTEGEATFNFCVINTESGGLLKVLFLSLNSEIYILTSRFKPGHKVVVVDAGYGVVDIHSYTVKSTSPWEVEEFREPQC